MKNKILFLNGGSCTNKEKRLIEEANKVNLQIDVMNCKENALIGDPRKFLEKMEGYSFIFSLSNQTYCNYFVNGFSLLGKETWPNNNLNKIRDKFLQAQFINSLGLKHPKTLLINTLEKYDLEKIVEKELGGFPCVIKKVTGTFGLNVGKVSSVEEIENFINEKIRIRKLTGVTSFLLQEFISEAVGEDYRVLVLNGEVLGGIKRTSSDSSDFRANISLGGIGSRFNVPEEVKEICLKISKELKGFYLGIDLIKKGDEWNVIEINPCPQFQGFEKATGINVAGKIIENFLK